MNLLILGGTGFIGTHQVQYALARGHRVTLFNRGRAVVTDAAPTDVESLIGDRDANDYRALVGRQFDACIDNATLTPRWVREAAQVLKGHIGHYSFISTTSVYASDADIGADETATREVYTGIDAMAHTPADVRANMSLYGPLKALAEDEAHRQFPGITAVIRPGLIVGPGDQSDRFTYWPVRIARGGSVLVPPLTDAVQFIDVRDVAEWSVRVAEQRTVGNFNAKGPDYELTMGALLRCICDVTSREAATNAAVLCEATADFLARHTVRAWSDLPVWIPAQGDTLGAHRRSVARAVASGLTYRALAVTVGDTIAWWKNRPLENQINLKTGLSSVRESELLAILQREASLN